VLEWLADNVNLIFCGMYDVQYLLLEDWQHLMAFMLNVDLGTPLPQARNGRYMREGPLKHALNDRYRAMGSRLSQELELDVLAAGWFRLCPGNQYFLNTVTNVRTKLPIPRSFFAKHKDWRINDNWSFGKATLHSYTAFMNISLGKAYVSANGATAIPSDGPWIEYDDSDDPTMAPDYDANAAAASTENPLGLRRARPLPSEDAE
jgi:hypothetical protein